jgi:hypothetical protein
MYQPGTDAMPPIDMDIANATKMGASSLSFFTGNAPAFSRAFRASAQCCGGFGDFGVAAVVAAQLELGNVWH